MSQILPYETRSTVPFVLMTDTIHPVSTLVNKPTNDDRRCVEPVAA